MLILYLMECQRTVSFLSATTATHMQFIKFMLTIGPIICCYLVLMLEKIYDL